MSHGLVDEIRDEIEPCEECWNFKECFKELCWKVLWNEDDTKPALQSMRYSKRCKQG